jgi:hypothetical protein
MNFFKENLGNFDFISLNSLIKVAFVDLNQSTIFKDEL